MGTRPRPLPPGRPRRPAAVIEPVSDALGNAIVPETAHFAVTDGPPDAPEFIDIDLTTDEGKIIYSMSEQIDWLRAELDQLHAQIEEQANLRFAFRSSAGRDQLVPLPARNPGETELVLKGTVKCDDLGRWDLYDSGPFAFVWENPAARPVPMPRCCVTGDGCPHITADKQYCRLCPGIPDEQRALLPEIVDGA